MWQERPRNLRQYEILHANYLVVTSDRLDTVLERHVVEAGPRNMEVHIVEADPDPANGIGLKVHEVAVESWDVGSIDRLAVDPMVAGP
jgi:hypothetical protein